MLCDASRCLFCTTTIAAATKAVEGIKALYPNANLSSLLIDHTSLSSVVAATETLLSIKKALHRLVNNAGIMDVPFSITKDGHEIHWQVNHLAHWLLAEKLLPLMLKTSKTLPAGSVRLVNITSGGHLQAPKGGINYADPTLPNSAAINRYTQSKLANI